MFDHKGTTIKICWAGKGLGQQFDRLHPVESKDALGLTQTTKAYQIPVSLPADDPIAQQLYQLGQNRGPSKG
jgi:hypothetical protein